MPSEPRHPIPCGPPPRPPRPRPNMPRTLLLSLEFCDPFSGNGLYARSLAGALSAVGPVCVISGRNGESPTPTTTPDPAIAVYTAPPHALHAIPLARWGRLDEGCDWAGYAAGVSALSHQVAAWAPTHILYVDWTGHRGAASLPLQLPSVYLNFRVFSRSFELHTAPHHSEFYRSAEAAAMQGAAVVLALCRADAAALADLAPSDVRLLLPPLRPDLPLTGGGGRAPCSPRLCGNRPKRGRRCWRGGCPPAAPPSSSGGCGWI